MKRKQPIHTILKEQEIKNRIKILQQQLDLVNTYRKEFEKNHGKKATEQIVNAMLDEYNLRIKQLQNFEK